MTNETAIDASQPSTFLRAGWNVAKRAPIVFVARAFFDLAALLVRVAALIGVGLLVALHLGVHVRQGGSILTWVDEFAVMIGRPESVIGIGGMLFTGWLALLLLESVTNSGIWSVLSDALQGRPDGSARRFFAGAFNRFPAALKHRVFTAGVDLTLLSVTIGTIAGTVGIARLAGATFASDVVVPALVWATVLTGFGVCAALLRLTTELVAAPMFVEGAGLGEAILRAAKVVARTPIRVYRMFVLAAGILVPPLMFYWVAVMLQNLAMEIPQLGSVAAITRMVAELVLLGGFAGFAVMLHAAFFAYYAWTAGRLATAHAGSRGATPRSLEEFLPDSIENVVPLYEVVGPWEDDQVMAPTSSPDSPENLEPPPSGSFVLDGILRRPDAQSEQEE